MPRKSAPGDSSPLARGLGLRSLRAPHARSVSTWTEPEGNEPSRTACSRGASPERLHGERDAPHRGPVRAGGLELTGDHAVTFPEASARSAAPTRSASRLWLQDSPRHMPSAPSIVAPQPSSWLDSVQPRVAAPDRRRATLRSLSPTPGPRNSIARAHPSRRDSHWAVDSRRRSPTTARAMRGRSLGLFVDGRAGRAQSHPRPT